MADALYTIFAGEVVRTTEKAVLFRFPDDNMTLPGVKPRGDVDRWIPRACCQDGDALEEGDTDISIAAWFCDQEGIA